MNVSLSLACHTIFGELFLCSNSLICSMSHYHMDIWDLIVIRSIEYYTECKHTVEKSFD